MKQFFYIGIKSAIVLIFASGLFAISLKTLGNQTLAKRQSFVMVSKHYKIENGATSPVKRTITTIVDQENERFKVITHLLSSGEAKVTFGNKVAFFDVTNKGLDYVAPSDSINNFNAEFIDEAAFRSNPLYVRESEVAGIKAFVLRNEAANYWMEEYYSPLTGFFALKRVSFDKDSLVETVEEATSIQFRKVAREECEFPKAPFNFTQAESRIEALRRMGTANALQRADQISADIEKVKRELEKKQK